MEDANQNNQMTGREFTENSNQNNWNYDPVTGKPYNGQKTYGNQNNIPLLDNENNNKDVENLCLAATCCWIIGNLLLFTEVAILAGVVLIVGFITAIVAMEKGRGNNYAKLVMVLYFLEIFIVIIAIIIAIQNCMSCLNGGCSEME